MYLNIVFLFSFAIFIGSEAASFNSRIVNGEDADIADYSYQVSLRNTFGGQHFCGGTIIGERHILTAAHCLYGRTSSFNVHTGTSYRLKEGNVYRAASFKIHPDFKMSEEDSVPNDIAVVTLSTPIKFNELQQPAKLPSHDVVDGSAANITGWGKSSTISTPNRLQKLVVKVTTAKTCQPHQNLPVLDSQICTITKKGTGMCFGDSGGPLVSNGEITGIVSYSEADYCGSDFPDVFTKVYSFLDFIKSIMNNN